mgnify:CR=1 FL=1
MQKIKYDKIRKLDKIVFLALGLILMALVIQMAILNWINNKNTAKMSEVLLDRVVNVIEKNEDDEKNMITSLKEDYIVRAKAVAYIINAKPEAETDVDELSISCGYVYSREKNWESFDEIANEADLRMYEAKEKYYSVEGRDRRR